MSRKSHHFLTTKMIYDKIPRRLDLDRRKRIEKSWKCPKQKKTLRWSYNLSIIMWWHENVRILLKHCNYILDRKIEIQHKFMSYNCFNNALSRCRSKENFAPNFQLLERNKWHKMEHDHVNSFLWYPFFR